VAQRQSEAGIEWGALSGDEYHYTIISSHVRVSVAAQTKGPVHTHTNPTQPNSTQTKPNPTFTPQFALFSGSAKLGFAPVAIKVGSKKTLGLYANITAGSVTIQLDYFRK